MSVNKSCKDFLRQEAQSWYSDQIVKQMKIGKLCHEIKVDTKISVIKASACKMGYEILRLYKKKTGYRKKWLGKIETSGIFIDGASEFRSICLIC